MKNKMDCGCEKDVFACREHAHPKHTPTPWAETNATVYAGKQELCDLNGDTLAQARANAAFIVRAVNCHEELLHLIRRIRQFDRQTPLLGTDMLFDIENAIARAEER